MATEAELARLRAARRAFIRAEHPDVGGDAEHFARGLEAFDRAAGVPIHGEAPDSYRRVTVRRSRRPDRVVARAVRGWHRRVTGRPQRHLL